MHLLLFAIDFDGKWLNRSIEWVETISKSKKRAKRKIKRMNRWTNIEYKRHMGFVILFFFCLEVDGGNESGYLSAYHTY